MDLAKTYLAVDFGGGSGRVMAGTLEAGKLQLEEIHRFGNRQVSLGKHLYWDFPALFQEMKEGLRKAATRFKNITSIGIDTWGVDFGLIDKEGNLLGNTVCYRDNRTDGMVEKFFNNHNATAHYALTGTQVMAINTLFQLYSMKEAKDCRLEMADRLLFMPDLFSYYLTGVANSEYTIASTSELLDAAQKTWAYDLISELGLPKKIFADIVMPGNVRGKLKAEIAKELGLPEIEVIAVGSHDTASAVMAVPSTHEPAAWLSSGTWSLLGTTIERPILSDAARKANFTNEGGADGNLCFLRNITGLWILQQLMKEWETCGETVDYSTLLHEAELAQSTSLLCVDNEIFQKPKSMVQTIQTFCKNQGGLVPETRGELTRCVLESLARVYQEALTELNRLLPAPVEKLYIIGGGSQNTLLNQLTANCANLPVVAGPVEATAIGNILIQAKAKGDLCSIEDLKQVVRQSVKTKTFKPL
ncbi:MAG: rhamnulokinase family protein [Bacteroidaceae bacterium]